MLACSFHSRKIVHTISTLLNSGTKMFQLCFIWSDPPPDGGHSYPFPTLGSPWSANDFWQSAMGAGMPSVSPDVPHFPRPLHLDMAAFNQHWCTSPWAQCLVVMESGVFVLKHKTFLLNCRIMNCTTILTATVTIFWQEFRKLICPPLAMLDSTPCPSPSVQHWHLRALVVRLKIANQRKQWPWCQGLQRLD